MSQSGASPRTVAVHRSVLTHECSLRVRAAESLSLSSTRRLGCESQWSQGRVPDQWGPCCSWVWQHSATMEGARPPAHRGIWQISKRRNSAASAPCTAAESHTTVTPVATSENGSTEAQQHNETGQRDERGRRPHALRATPTPSRSRGRRKRTSTHAHHVHNDARIVRYRLESQRAHQCIALACHFEHVREAPCMQAFRGEGKGSSRR